MILASTSLSLPERRVEFALIWRRLDVVVRVCQTWRRLEVGWKLWSGLKSLSVHVMRNKGSATSHHPLSLAAALLTRLAPATPRPPARKLPLRRVRATKVGIRDETSIAELPSRVACKCMGCLSSKPAADDDVTEWGAEQVPSRPSASTQAVAVKPAAQDGAQPRSSGGAGRDAPPGATALQASGGLQDQLSAVHADVQRRAGTLSRSAAR